MGFGQRQALLGEGVEEIAVLTGVEAVFEAIDLALEPFFGGFVLTLGQLLELLDRVFCPVQVRVVGAHGPADGELRDDGRDGQPVQRLGDEAVAVLTVAKPNADLRSSTHRPGSHTVGIPMALDLHRG
jgi:hypothetical protein